MTTPPNQLHFKGYRSYLTQLQRWYKQPIAFVSTALILTIFTIAFFAFFAIRPTLGTVAELVRKIDDQKQVEQKLVQKAAALATVQSEYLFAQDKLKLLEIAIPYDNQLSRMLKEIEYLAAAYQLPVSSIQLNDFDLIQTAGGAKNDAVQSIPVSVVTHGAYSSLRAFLTDLMRLDRVMSIDSFTMVESKRKDEPGLSLTVFFRAYYLPESVK